MSTDVSSTESAMSDLSDDVFVNKSHDVHCRKRTRTTITRQHKAKLELIFQANRYQSRLDLADIARNIGLSQHVIKVFFIFNSCFIFFVAIFINNLLDALYLLNVGGMTYILNNFDCFKCFLILFLDENYFSLPPS